MGTRTPSSSTAWIKEAAKLAKKFASDQRILLSKTDRQLSAAFEVGSLHALLRFYKTQGYELTPTNLTRDGEYKYLTSPSGNPANYSYVLAKGSDGEFEIRQQVRVESYVDEHIAFTPDIVVLVKGAVIDSSKHEDYAGGKRSYFRVSSPWVVAAHECKSMNPFPELLVSFIGMLVTAHEWYPDGSSVRHTNQEGHLAPTLFVGGTARGLHWRMIAAMHRNYSLNIICGLHEGTWQLTDAKNRLIWTPGGKVPFPLLEDADVPF